MDTYSAPIIIEQAECLIFSSVLAELISHHHGSGQTKERNM